METDTTECTHCVSPYWIFAKSATCHERSAPGVPSAFGISGSMDRDRVEDSVPPSKTRSKRERIRSCLGTFLVCDSLAIASLLGKTTAVAPTSEVQSVGANETQKGLPVLLFHPNDMRFLAFSWSMVSVIGGTETVFGEGTSSR